MDRYPGDDFLIGLTPKQKKEMENMVQPVDFIIF